MLQNNFGAVIVAAGSSRRMGASQSKVLMVMLCTIESTENGRIRRLC